MPKKAKRMYMFKDGVTQSMLSDWQSCRMRAKYKLDLWEPARKSSAALCYGNIVHKILEEVYSFDKQPSLKNIDNTMELVLDQICGEQSDLYDPDPQVVELCSAKAFGVLAAYFKHWRKEDKKLQFEYTELVFDTEWTGARLRGKVDGLLKQGKELWLFETKTKGQVREDVLPVKLDFDFQSLFYILALENLLKVKIKGVLYNVIRNPTLRQGKQDLHEYQDRLFNDALERNDHYFFRYKVPFHKKQREEFERELMHKLEEFEVWSECRHIGLEFLSCSNVSDYERPIATYKNESACVTRFTCPFIQACAQSNMAGYSQTRELFKELKPL
jgi:hypothetical protein